MFERCSLSFFHLFKILRVARAALANGIASADRTAAVLRACAGIDDGFPAVAVLTLPPNSAATAWQNLFWCEVAVFCWVPFGSDLWIFCGEIVESRQDFDVLAIWATAVTSCAAGDDGLVFVAFVADPPDFLIAGWGDLVWPQRAILRRVPLTSELGILAGEIVFAGDDFFAGADRAACAMVAAGNVGLPFVAVLADPPHFAATAGEHIARCQIAIFRRMPLAGELGIDRRQIVHASEHHAIGANRTAGTADTRFYLRLPFVAVLADPPRWAVAARQHVRRLQSVIFCRMPGGSDGWVAGSEIVHAFYDTSPVTIFTPTGWAV